MDKIFYKKLDASAEPIGHLAYVRPEENAEFFLVVYQPDLDKWLVLFNLNMAGEGAAKCLVFTKRGSLRHFTLSGAFKFINNNSNEGNFRAFFDPEFSLKAIAKVHRK